MRISPAIPILRSFSEEKAKEFYLDFLGFKLDWEHRFEANFPLYAQVSRSGLTLHLSEHHGDATPGSTVFVRMEGIDALHQELTGKRADSSPKCNTLEFIAPVSLEVKSALGQEQLGRTLPSQRLARSHIEHEGNVVQLCLGVATQV